MPFPSLCRRTDCECNEDKGLCCRSKHCGRHNKRCHVDCRR